MTTSFGNDRSSVQDRQIHLLIRLFLPSINHGLPQVGQQQFHGTIQWTSQTKMQFTMILKGMYQLQEVIRVWVAVRLMLLSPLWGWKMQLTLMCLTQIQFNMAITQ
jgi:hypothetical protein